MKYGPIGFLWSGYAFSFQSLAWGEQVGFKNVYFSYAFITSVF